MSDLANVQGLVVRGYTHPFSIHLPIKFASDKAGARSLLLAILDRLGIATAAEWRVRPPTLLNMGLTAAGLLALGMDASTLNLEFPPDFTEGASLRLRTFGDVGPSDPDNWWGNPSFDQDAQAILHIYGDTEDNLEKQHRRLGEVLAEHGAQTIMHQINGGTIKGMMLPQSREHFGFKDGISQPQVTWPEIGIRKFEAAASQPVDSSWFLTGRGGPANGKPAFGKTGDVFRDSSYLVFRILQQDVTAFRQFCSREASTLREEFGDEAAEVQDWPAFVAAKMVGRWSDGHSLVRAPFSPPTDQRMPPDNDFCFEYQDPDGVKCPFSAHIRLANARDQLLSPIAAPHGVPPLLRRGVPYGPSLPPDSTDDRERGLIGMFVCASIARQFEKILGWMSRADFSPVFADANGGGGNARDPVVATRSPCSDNPPPVSAVHLIQRRGVPCIQTQALDNFVTTRGTVYTILPTLTALRALAAGIKWSYDVETEVKALSLAVKNRFEPESVTSTSHRKRVPTQKRSGKVKRSATARKKKRTSKK